MATTVAGVLTAVLGVLLYWRSQSLPSGASAASDPALLPGAVGIALALCGIGLVISVSVRRVAAGRTDSPALGDDATSKRPGDEGPTATYLVQTLVFLATVGLAGWAALRLGFLTFTGLLLVGSALLLEQDRHTTWSVVRSVVIGALITAAIYVIFTAGLRVRFPGTLLP